MFTWINNHGVRSDRGFIVRFTGRSTAEYRDGEKLVTLDIENGISGGHPCIILHPSAFTKWDDGEPIDKNKQRQLFEDFEDALAFQDLKMIVQGIESGGE